MPRGVKRVMNRWIPALLSAVSLVLSVMVAALWVLSYRFPPNRAGGDVLNISRDGPQWWVISARGRVTLCRQDAARLGREFPGFDAAGFKYGGLRGPNGSLYNAAVPHGFIVMLLLLPPAAFAGSFWRRLHRSRPGLCASCRYNLTGNLSGVCPECGGACTVGPCRFRHEARHVLPPLAIASALLCAAAVALWRRSYTAAEELHFLTGGRGYYVEVARGRAIYFAADTAVKRPGRDWGYVRYADAGTRRGAMAAIERQVSARSGTGFQAAGVTFRLTDPGPGRRSVVAVPGLASCIRARRAAGAVAPDSAEGGAGRVPLVRVRPAGHAEPVPGMRGRADLRTPLGRLHFPSLQRTKEGRPRRQGSAAHRVAGRHGSRIH